MAASLNAILLRISPTACSSITAIESATDSFSVKKLRLQRVCAKENHLVQMESRRCFIRALGLSRYGRDKIGKRNQDDFAGAHQKSVASFSPTRTSGGSAIMSGFLDTIKRSQLR